MPFSYRCRAALALAACLAPAPALALQPSAWEKVGNWHVSPEGGTLCWASTTAVSGHPLVLHAGPDRLLRLTFFDAVLSKRIARHVTTIALDGVRTSASASGIVITSQDEAAPVDQGFLSAFADARVVELIARDGRTIERVELAGAAQVVARMRSCAAAVKVLPPPPSTPPPSTPPAPASDTSNPRRAQPLVPPFRVLSDMDYPAAAVRAGEQGVVGLRLDVAADGRVTGCTITSSSGSAILDSATCELLRRRLRFRPARDAGGKAMPDTYNARIAWRLPQPAPQGEEPPPPALR